MELSRTDRQIDRSQKREREKRGAKTVFQLIMREAHFEMSAITESNLHNHMFTGVIVRRECLNILIRNRFL